MNPETIPMCEQLFWFLPPSRFEEAVQMMVASRSDTRTEPVAKRPTMDAWGDPIEQMQITDGIAVVPVKGVLMNGATGSDKRFGFVDYADVVGDIQTARDQGAAAAVLDVNSPGGGAIGAQSAAMAIGELSASFPIFSFTAGLQCSAAEYISASAERYATLDAIVGSIGTVMASLSFQGMLEKFGIKATVFTSGKFKAAMHPMKDMTAEQETQIQSFVDELGNQFKAHVGTYRKKVQTHSMEGQFFTGAAGASNGLYDGNVRSLADVISIARQTIG